MWAWRCKPHLLLRVSQQNSSCVVALSPCTSAIARPLAFVGAVIKTRRGFSSSRALHAVLGGSDKEEITGKVYSRPSKNLPSFMNWCSVCGSTWLWSSTRLGSASSLWLMMGFFGWSCNLEDISCLLCSTCARSRLYPFRLRVTPAMQKATLIPKVQHSRTYTAFWQVSRRTTLKAGR